MLSPSYPPRIFFFAKRFKEVGFDVFGMGDAAYAQLNFDLKSSLRYYIRQDLDCFDPNSRIVESKYQPIRKKVEKLIAEYGRIDAIESFNEWWLPVDARLRQDFGVEGLKPDELEHLNRKSKMKEKFTEAGAATARGEIVRDVESMLAFKRAVGGDIIAKPDRGLGSASTYRLKTDSDIHQFWKKRKSGADYFMEKFIQDENRQFMSFDGLTDGNGDIIFYTAHVYNDGDLEIATTGKTIYYYNLKRSEIPAKFREIGFHTVKAFNLRKRFFHIEFFKIGDEYYGVEINARPPGFVHLDMMNYASGIDIWAEYARVMKGEKVVIRPTCDRICMQIGRFNRIKYRHSAKEILQKYYSNIAYQCALGVNLYGDWVLLILTDNHEQKQEIIDFAVKQN